MAYEILSVGDEKQAETTTEVKVEETITEVTTPEVVPGDEGTTTTVETTEEVEPDSGYFFGDTQVDIEIPEDISTALAEKGINSESLMKELFAKEGKFELKEKTRTKLYDAFGKTMVDGYLSLYKQQNTLALSEYNRKETENRELHTKQSEEFTTLVGGDDGWDAIGEWASESLSDGELEAFNAVMTLPTEHWAAQRAVLEAIKIKMGASVEKPLSLIGDDPNAGVTTKAGGLPSQLTRSEFQEIMYSERYAKDKNYASAIDAIRRNSAEKGIA